MRPLGCQGVRRCGALEWGLPLYRIYDTVDRWHNIRVYREKLRDDAAVLA